MRGGVSCLKESVDSEKQVFPTCVGVFLRKFLNARIDLRLPHMRGGVSYRMSLTHRAKLSSPHAWGCFLALS